MATTKQRKATKVVVNGGTPTDGMREANYAPSVIRKPEVLTKSKGYKEVLAEYGLTEELVTAALVEDISNKPQNRLGEMRLGAEILGMNKREDSETKIFADKIQINYIVPDADNLKADTQATPRISGSE